MELFCDNFIIRLFYNIFENFADIKNETCRVRKCQSRHDRSKRRSSRFILKRQNALLYKNERSLIFANFTKGKKNYHLDHLYYL